MEKTDLNNHENDVLPPLTFTKTLECDITADRIEIDCLKCGNIYEFPQDKDDYLAHLFLDHRLVIADIDDIAELEEYLRYWKKEFQEHEFEQYCTTMLLDQLPDGTPAKNEKYYLLSDILPQDNELRKRLQQHRLEKALSRHQFERTDRQFCKECLYCRDVIQGLRADYLEHLFNKHFLQLGKPENLVYVDELISKVQQNLENLVCLYCTKVFKDRVTLKDHMRKKGHKRINPNNSAYDKYFLINYRNEKPKLSRSINKKIIKSNPQNSERRRKKSSDNEACTRTEKLKSDLEPKRKTTESTVGFYKQFGVSDDSDSDWSDWNGEAIPPLNCLYCKYNNTEFISLKNHMHTEHQLDFDAAIKGLHFYQKIKMVNYVRRQICLLRCVTCNERCETTEALLEHMSSKNHFSMGTQKQWDKPEFFFPTYEDDGLLCILDDNLNDNVDDTVVRIIAEETVAQINKDAERLSLENFQYL